MADVTEIFLILCGLYNIAFAIFHLLFWKIFDWKEDLKNNSIANRAIIQILNIRLIYIFILMGLIYLFFSEQLMNSTLGKFILVGFFGFWLGRTIEQFIFLRLKSRFVHILTTVFILGTVFHFIPLLQF